MLYSLPSLHVGMDMLQQTVQSSQGNERMDDLK